MSDYQMALESYRADITELEVRARAVRDAWFSADYEANELEADQLDDTARALRRSLAQIMRTSVVGGLDQDEEEGQPNRRREMWFE